MSSLFAVHIGLHLWLTAQGVPSPSPSPLPITPAHAWVQKQKVALPSPHLNELWDLAFLVSATAPTLHAALAQEKLIEVVPDKTGTSLIHTYAGATTMPQVRWQQLRVRPLHERVDDRPLWLVVPLDAASLALTSPTSDRPADEEPGACVDAASAESSTQACELRANEPWTLLSQGLASTTWVRVDGAPQAKMPWVMLRHAASELGAQAGQKAALTEASYARPRDSAGTCAPHDTYAPPVPVVDVANSVVWHSATREKRLALTFDACSTYGYGPFNPAVIAALRAEGVPATLFVGGHWAEMHPAELEGLAQDPLFEIGNHTYSHPHMRDLSPDAQQQQLLWTQQIIFERTGILPRMFRPPYGEVDDVMLGEVARAGLYTVEYDLPAGDADVHVSPARLRHWVVDHATAGSIVIMHMNRPKNHTAEALPDIVRDLRRQGFAFCQMTDLLLGDGSGCR